MILKFVKQPPGVRLKIKTLLGINWFIQQYQNLQDFAFGSSKAECMRHPGI